MAARQAVLGIDGGAFFYGSKRVFSGVTFLLDDARTALVGENGVGKSTLLKCLAGELELNRGKIVRSRGLRVGYLPQEVPPGLGDLSVRAVLRRSLERVGLENDDWRIDVMLDEIDMPPDMAELAFGQLSGGWQRLMLIAGAARLEEPDILVLDEPTNHLDIGNIETLEGWLTERIRLPMLIVSHDRAFLARVSTRTLFLRADGVHAFKVPFLEARRALLERDAADAARARLEDKEIKRLEKVAARYRAWGVKNDRFDRQAKATLKRIARIEAGRAEVWRPADRRIELGESDLEARAALRVRGLTVTTPDGARALVKVDHLAIAPGECVALLGANGAGKSTLLGALAGAFDPRNPFYDGSAPVRFNPAARLVYFDQSLRDLPLDASLLDWLIDADGVTERDALRGLAQAGFPHARVREPIAILSFGERSRLAFLKMKLMRPNLYLLDEPTSHLDIEGQEDLESQLEETDVACLFVSHDRFFTRAVATRFLEIRKGRLVEVENADDFFEDQHA
jgi:ATPase subunit of ABC transporter with duplicated ATPase domains